MKALLHWALVGAALAYLGYQTPMLIHSADQGIGAPAHAQWGYVTLAAAFNLGAVLLNGELHRQLLLVGRVRMSVTGPSVAGE